MSYTYKNLVFTKHAWERLSDRSLTQDVVFQVIQSPDKTVHNQHNFKFIRTVSERTVHVVATPIEHGQWLIISTWVRGEEDKKNFVWELLVTPFRIVWWIIKSLWFALFGKK